MSEQGRPSDLLRLHVAGPNAAAELTVYDHSFKPLQSGVGELDLDLPPGLYDLEARIANRAERKTVALVESTKTVGKGDWDLKFRTAAPLPQSSSLRQAHQEAAQRWSRQPTWTASEPGECRLFLFLRFVQRESHGEWKRPADRFWSGLKLHRGDGTVVTDFSVGVQSSAAEGWCAFTADLAQGGYFVSAPAPSGGDICLPVWLQPNFETHIFIPFFEHPALDVITMTMAPKGDGFVSEKQTAGEYSEALLAGFQRGRDLLNTDLIQKMLDEKVYNPFAGIVTAHALMRDPERKTDGLLRTLIVNLRRDLGNHPDVLALEIVSQQRTDVALNFPPILRIAFDAVLSRSASEPAVLEVNNIVTEALGTLLPGQYTLWYREPPTGFEILTKLRDGVLKLVSGLQVPALSGLLNFLRRGGLQWENFDFEDAINSFATWVRTQDPGILAHQLGLPRVVIEKVIARITGFFPELRRMSQTSLKDADFSVPIGTSYRGAALFAVLAQVLPTLQLSALEQRVIQLLAERWEEGNKGDENSSHAERCRRKLSLLASTALKAHDLLPTDSMARQDAMLITCALAGLAAKLYPFLLVGKELEIKLAAGSFAAIFGQTDKFIGSADNTPLGPSLSGTLQQLLSGSGRRAEEFTPVFVRNGVALAFLRLQENYWAADVEMKGSPFARNVDPSLIAPSRQAINQALIVLTGKLEDGFADVTKTVREAIDPTTPTRDALERLPDEIGRVWTAVQRLVSSSNITAMQ